MRFPRPRSRERLARNRLALVLHNLPAGNWEAGERGIACHPDRVGEFQDGVGKAIEYAKALGVPQLNCLAGHRAARASTRDAARATFVANLAFAAAKLEAEGLRLLIEPINTYDIPGFFLSRHASGARHHRRDRQRQSLPPVRHLSHAAHGGRAREHDQDEPRAHRPPAARRQSGKERAGNRRDQLRVPVPRTSTRWATMAGSAASTSPRRPPPPACRGSRRTADRAHAERANPESSSMANIGFIGLGIMGAPMAGHLVAGGHSLFAYSRRERSRGAPGKGRRRLRVERRGREAERHRHPHGAGHAERRGGAVRRERRRPGTLARARSSST